MKSVWSDETGRIINKVNKISCCVLLTSFYLKNCHDTQLQWKVIEHFWNSIIKNVRWSYKNHSQRKIYFEIKNFPEPFFMYVNLTTVKIWGQTDKFPLSFSSLKCLLRVKKLIREDCAKNVNQTGNFYFRPKRKTAISPPIFDRFQYFVLH